MKMKTFITLTILTLLLAAFAAPASAATNATYVSFLPLVDHSQSFAAINTSASTTTTSTISTASVSSSSYAPLPTDSALKRDKVFLDLESSRLLVSATLPVSVQAVIVGNLPDPCHILRAVVGLSSTSRTINISVYSLFNPGTACITVLKPFSVTLPLGTFTSGTYIVLVNGERLGSFSVGSTITSVGK